ncbi:MAG: hypothetical protein PVG39_10195 [Desulfobacteraceae bacterium]
MRLGERYRLELHWKKIAIPEPGIMTLTGAYFSGPALAEAEKINDNDYIRLDFCSQLIIIASGLYVGDLKWGAVTYGNKSGKPIVKLSDAYIKYDPTLRNIATLKNRDYLVIDTSGHENEKHLYNLLYTTYVVDKDNELYNYRR